MHKRIYLFTFFITFSLFSLFSIQHLLAKEKNIYYNEEYRYSLEFPDDWYIFSEEMRKQITPDELSDSASQFIKEDGTSQLYIRNLSLNDRKAEIYIDILNHIKNTPKNKLNMDRLLNPVVVTFGQEIEDYAINEYNSMTKFLLKQTSSLYGEIYTTVIWKKHDNILLEFEFTHFVYEESSFDEALKIVNTLFKPKQVSETNMREGKIEMLSSKLIENKNINSTSISKAYQFATNPLVQFIGVATLLVLTLMIIGYKRL